MKIDLWMLRPWCISHDGNWSMDEVLETQVAPMNLRLPFWVWAVRAQAILDVVPFIGALRTEQIQVCHVHRVSRKLVLFTMQTASEENLYSVRRIASAWAEGRILSGLSGMCSSGKEEWSVYAIQALTACDHNVYTNDVITMYNTIESSPFQTRLDYFEHLRAIYDAVVSLQHARITEVVSRFMAYIANLQPPLLDLVRACVDLTAMLLATVRPPADAESPLWWREVYWLSYIREHCLKLKDIEGLLLDTVFALLGDNGRTSAVHRDRVVEKVKRIIASELDQDISLAKLAERVYVTPSYLSALFKQETGHSIREWIMHARIERAKQLLKECKDIKVYEIGARVGYPDPVYFNKLFKRIVGLTPKQYASRYTNS